MQTLIQTFFKRANIHDPEHSLLSWPEGEVRLFINELFEHLDFPKPDNLPAVSFAQAFRECK